MFAHVRVALLWSMGFPLGAVFLGLYLIILLLGDEVARFDSEQRAKFEFGGTGPTARSADAAHPAGPPPSKTTSDPARPTAPGLPPNGASP